jgi:hypothetical protein
VDLSLSFLVTVSFYSPMKLVSLPTSNEGTCRRQLVGIAPVSLVEESSLMVTATNLHDVEMLVARERTSPIVHTPHQER